MNYTKAIHSHYRKYTAVTHVLGRQIAELALAACSSWRRWFLQGFLMVFGYERSGFSCWKRQVPWRRLHTLCRKTEGLKDLKFGGQVEDPEWGWAEVRISREGSSHLLRVRGQRRRTSSENPPEAGSGTGHVGSIVPCRAVTFSSASSKSPCGNEGKGAVFHFCVN